MKSPFPYFGGKSRVASLVWDRFGNVPNYVEPFFGSGAVLLGRPHPAGTETVNDLDCMIANFWRALQHSPEEVAHYADSPVNEADQHARHLWLCSQAEFRERMKVEPKFYDAQIAGWWVWGQCCWIGPGWCSVKLPHLSDAGKGVHRKLPHLGNTGKGVHRKLPHLGNAGNGLYQYMGLLGERLRRVRVACGDWSRVLGPSVTTVHGVTGVFLDPPYLEANMDYAAGGVGTSLATEVAAWAIANGESPKMRIALCGFEGDYEMPASWECVPWKTQGGMAANGSQAKLNTNRERIWFSPHCLHVGLFSGMSEYTNQEARAAMGHESSLVLPLHATPTEAA